MAHVKKFAASALGGILDHLDRQEDDGKNRSNEDIDPTRTALNYAIGLKGSKHDRSAVFKRIAEVKQSHEKAAGRKPRKDAVLICDWVITAPKDLAEEDYRKFFRETMRFLHSRYGRENVPVGFVHMDETTPHIHVPVIPERDGKFQGKKVVSQYDLQTFHKDLQAWMNNAGIQCSVMLDEEDKLGKVLSGLSQEDMAILRQAIDDKVASKTAVERSKLAESKNRVDTLKTELEAREDALRAAMDEIKPLRGGQREVLDEFEDFIAQSGTPTTLKEVRQLRERYETHKAARERIESCLPTSGTEFTEFYAGLDR